MIRLVKMTGKWYGIKIESLISDQENIEQFAEEGTPVVLVDDIDTALDFLELEEDEITMVE